MTKNLWHSIGGGIVLALFVAAAHASPTSADFSRCHQIVGRDLASCLDAQADARTHETCWRRARAAKDACYSELYDIHAKPDRERREAEREAAQRRTDAD